jgi:hypothetical protein
MIRETYFRTGSVAFSVRAVEWPDGEAADLATDYLASYVCGLPTKGVRVLHSALLHERQEPEAAPPASYAEAIRQTRDREGRAVLYATADWLFRPTSGHTIRLLPAGDASEAGE